MSVLSQEPSQPPSYWRYHPGPHLLQGNTGQEAPVQVLCCIPKGSTAHHSLHFSSIYYKRRKLQLLSVVATSGFDKILFFCFLQLTGKPGAGKPQLPFPFPFLHALQGTVCSRQSWKSNWLPFALLNVPRDLRNPPQFGFLLLNWDFKLFQVVSASPQPMPWHATQFRKKETQFRWWKTMQMVPFMVYCRKLCI